jgi:hypothetical protein
MADGAVVVLWQMVFGGSAVADRIIVVIVAGSAGGDALAGEMVAVPVPVGVEAQLGGGGVAAAAAGPHHLLQMGTCLEYRCN